MTEPTPKATETKAKRQPYDSIPRLDPGRIGDPCTRSSDLIIPGLNRRTEA